MDELQRQVERGALFTHTALGESFSRTNEGQTFLYGLADVLLAKGYVTETELKAAVDNVQAELTLRGEASGARTLVRVDDATSSTVLGTKVDCSGRLHICKAVCCRLGFALTVSEIEEGQIKWDLGRPYFIRHDTNGMCVHNESPSAGCSVYLNRPGVCRRYSCAQDARIWKNFEQMELNAEWIEKNLTGLNRPRAIRILMHESGGSGNSSALSAPSAGS